MSQMKNAKTEGDLLKNCLHEMLTCEMDVAGLLLLLPLAESFNSDGRLSPL